MEENAAEAFLRLNIETMDRASRAGVAGLPDNEKMRSVRVIVLHADKTVEHNRLFPLEGAEANESILLKVRSDEKKKIFLFANEESVSVAEGWDTAGEDRSLTTFFDSFSEGSPGFEAAVEKISFVPSFSDGRPLPMSSDYVIDFPAKGNFEGTFYVVRAATKFNINFINLRGEEVRINSFALESYADRNFLMAHVADSEENRLLFNGKSWIDWLKEVSDASSENDDAATTEAAGWLRDYLLPPGTDTGKIFRSASSLTVPAAQYDAEDPAEVTPGKTSVTFYLPESKNQGPDGEQEYTLTVDIDGVSAPFVNKLPNLKALFRNTNVIVNVTMDRKMIMEVEVIPFRSVEVTTPELGMERDDFTGYVVGKDSEGNKCWYVGTDGKNGPYYLGPKGSEGKSVTINGKEYMLVYAEYRYYNEQKTYSGFNRTPYNLHHIIEKVTDAETGKESLKFHYLSPEGRTGYEQGTDTYFNELKYYVWLDEGGDRFGPEKDQWGNPSIYKALTGVGLDLVSCRILYEWDRSDWNKARFWGWPGVYPKYWFDVLGNRYPWSDYADRETKLGDWTNYLDTDDVVLP